MGSKVLLETTWTDEGFITTRMGTSMYFSIISTMNSNWWVIIKDSPFSRVGFDFFAGDAVADTEARFLDGGIYSSAACVVSFTLPSIFGSDSRWVCHGHNLVKMYLGCAAPRLFFREPQALALALTYQRKTQRSYIYSITTEDPLKKPYDGIINLLRVVLVL